MCKGSGTQYPGSHPTRRAKNAALLHLPGPQSRDDRCPVQALEANPEFYTAWNFRREILGRTIAGARQEFPEPGAGLQAAVSAALAGELALLAEVDQR